MSKISKSPTFLEFISRDSLGWAGIWFPAAIWVFTGIVGPWALAELWRRDTFDEQLAATLLGIVSLTIGISILGFAWSWRRYSWICGVLQTGERVCGQITAIASEARSRSCILYFEYTYQGIHRTSSQRSRDEVHIPSREVTVVVNPDDPTDAYIEEVLLY